jgi:hypothetical protein
MNKQKVWTTLLAFLLIGTILIPTASVFAAEDATSTDSEWVTEDNSTSVDEDTYTEEDIDPALLEEYDQAMSYIDQLTPLQNYEDTAINHLHQLGVLNAKTRKQVYSKLTKTIIPNYTKFVKGMKKIKPENEELIAIHQQTLQAISLQLQGMTSIQKSVSTNKINLKTLNTGIDKLTTGSAMIDEVYDDFNTYVTKFQ